MEKHTELLRAALYLCNAIPNTAPRGFEEATGFRNSYALASAIGDCLGREPEPWFTVIDQDGYQRGQFLSEAAARDYLNAPPKFLDPARSHIKRLEAGQ